MEKPYVALFVVNVLTGYMGRWLIMPQHNYAKESEKQNYTKPQFNPSLCFTFFGNWMDAIESIETESDTTSNAYALFKAIAYYSMYERDPDLSNHPLLRPVWKILEGEIDRSLTNRKRHYATDEAKLSTQKVLKALVEYPQKSLRQIGEITQTSKDVVRRVKKMYQQEIEQEIANRLNSATVADSGYCADSIDATLDDVSDGTVGDVNANDTCSYYTRHDTRQEENSEFDYDEGDMPF